jgi:hypothetical protein
VSASSCAKAVTHDGDPSMSGFAAISRRRTDEVVKAGAGTTAHGNRCAGACAAASAWTADDETLRPR